MCVTIHLCIHSVKSTSNTCGSCIDYKAVWDPEQVSTLQGPQNFLPLSVTERRFLGHPIFSQVTVLTELSLPLKVLFCVPCINQMYCATNQKVAVSIPDGVMEFSLT
jgi:hypothetical protein